MHTDGLACACARRPCCLFFFFFFFFFLRPFTAQIVGIGSWSGRMKPGMSSIPDLRSARSSADSDDAGGRAAHCFVYAPVGSIPLQKNFADRLVVSSAAGRSSSCAALCAKSASTASKARIMAWAKGWIQRFSGLSSPSNVRM